MRIERYYASLKEESSHINSAALQLLNRQDYVGFFKACGPNFVRGIRRAQEVTAIFEFKSTNLETASEYASDVQVQSGFWYDEDSEEEKESANAEKYNAINRSLRISIVGYGLGLSEEGSETLMATSLKEYHQVMKFAYTTMVKSKNGMHIGQVYGIEVLPWVDNVQFQIAAGLQEEVIEIPIPRSLIPRAYRVSDPTDFDFDRNNRGAFRCKNPENQMDKYGYCCEAGQLYDRTEEEYDPFDPQTKVCKPLRALDKSMVKENMVSNGEFLARLDRSLRYKMNQMHTLEKCISAARAIPERFDYHVLKYKDSVQFSNSTELLEFTPFELKMALDPFGDFKLLKHMAQEIDEFTQMFYQPCLHALFGANIGTGSSTDPSFFMAYPWYTHDECTKLSCFGNSMRWDRTDGEGGCIPSLISGATSKGYDWDDANCAKNEDSADDSCKYDSHELYDTHFKLVHCWSETLPAGRVDFFMSQFCMPEITTKKIPQEKQDELKAAYTQYCVINDDWKSNQPSIPLSTSPSLNPSLSSNPSLNPSQFPSESPSTSSNPSLSPSTSSNPSLKPSQIPSLGPSTSSNPSVKPSQIPSLSPSTSSNPSLSPSQFPSESPSEIPSSNPSLSPSLSSNPSLKPSQFPSVSPSQVPSSNPSLKPSQFPSLSPSVSSNPSLMPSQLPSLSPSQVPSSNPSLKPSQFPSVSPSRVPSSNPSLSPSVSSNPSLKPSQLPSLKPSPVPSSHPSVNPSQFPSLSPSQVPSNHPSQHPSDKPTRSAQ